MRERIKTVDTQTQPELTSLAKQKVRFFDTTMYTPTHNPNDSSRWYDYRPSIVSLVRPTRLGISKTAEGWRIDISSLTPSDAMTILTHNIFLEESTILCSSGTPHWVARMCGSIGMGDANTIRRELSTMHSPLCADLRMQSLVMSSGGDGICAHVRAYDDALLLGAGAMAHFVADILSDTTSLPDLGLVDNLLERTGHLSIRPIDTEIFSTFVDVGVSTMGSTGSVDTSIIYDIHSNSWHGD